MFATLLVCSLLAAEKPVISCIESDPKTGSSLAVVLDEAPLAHTTQLFGSSKERDAGRQLSGLLDQLSKELEGVKSGLDQVVKLNIHLARSSDMAAVQKTLARRFAGKHKPAVCFSIGTPAQSGTLVSLDAVAIAGVTEDKPNMRILPAGPVLYVSGQAESGLTLVRATRRTLESLRATLEHFGRDDSHIIQIKAFVNPMEKIADVRKEIVSFYGKDKAPPVVLVEWTAKDSIEIELIASAKKSKSKEWLDYLTPPNMTSSPVFSRVTRINQGRRIYTSGIPGIGKDGEAQVKDFFVRLEKVLKATKSDLRHMAKATYLVSTEESSKQLNMQRLKVYDAKRPPAASKAGVVATGVKDCGLVVDLIAVEPQ
jgi:enamine deaminase RidA (YjgF/YER057c/UK114 family)